MLQELASGTETDGNTYLLVIESILINSASKVKLTLLRSVALLDCEPYKKFQNPVSFVHFYQFITVERSMVHVYSIRKWNHKGHEK